MATDDQTPPARRRCQNSLSVSAAGRDLVKLFVAFSESPCLASSGLTEIGYRHVLRPGDDDLVRIDEAQADLLLRNDLRCVEIYLNATTRVPLEQHEFDALVSLVFDVGMFRFEHSRLRKLINSGDLEGGAQALQHWQEEFPSDELGAMRRNAEATLFRRGEVAIGG